MTDYIVYCPDCDGTCTDIWYQRYRCRKCGKEFESNQVLYKPIPRVPGSKLLGRGHHP